MSIPTWFDLRTLGSSKVVQSAGIWTVIVPIAAKLFSEVNQIILAGIGGSIINFSLPFSWEILFFSSLFFLAANLIYLFRCPSLIKSVKNYNDFCEQRRSPIEIRESLPVLEKEKKLSEEQKQIWERWFADRAIYLLAGNSEKHEHLKANSTYLIESEDKKLSDAFFSIVSAWSQVHPLSRFICALFYAFGLTGIAYLMYQNTIFVASQLAIHLK